VDGHALGDWAERRHVAHGVGRRAEPDVALDGGVAGAVRNGPRIASVGGGPCRGNNRTVARSTERPDVGRQLLVDGAAVKRGQAGCGSVSF